MPDYTPTQQRILLLLSDGLPHTREEMLGCINDELSSMRNLRTHLVLLRKKLNMVGQSILYEFQGFPPKTVYRHVRLLANACDGKS